MTDFVTGLTNATGTERTLFETSKIRILSDSIIVSLRLTEKEPLFKDGDKAKDIAAYIMGFLSLVSGLCLVVASRMGYFLRGGITIGQYHDAHLRGNTGELFLFSKALVDAYQLQRKLAKFPRVLIGFSVFEYLHKFMPVADEGILTFENLVIHDTDRLAFLNIYQVLNMEPGDSNTATMLKNIAEKVRIQVADHQAQGDILDKYRWFADYHNKKVSGARLGTELKIPKF